MVMENMAVAIRGVKYQKRKRLNLCINYASTRKLNDTDRIQKKR